MSSPTAPQHTPDPSQPTTTLAAQATANAPTAAPTDAFFYSSAQWTADGTTLLVESSKNTVSTFVLPPDLHQAATDTRPRPRPQILEPQSTTQLPEPSQCVAPAPYFSLANPHTQTFLVGCRDHPLHLYHAFPSPVTDNDDDDDDHAAPPTSTPLCMYKLIRHETEAFITPSSILWPSPGTHFLCGSANRIDIFDASRPGPSGPLQTIHTIPSRRHNLKGGGVGMKGTVSALSTHSSPSNSSSNIIAAGTRTRWIGLYDIHRAAASAAVANWTVAGADEQEFNHALGGRGIVQTIWSPCGRYLVVNERRASGLLVYDIRGAGRLLSLLAGRHSLHTQQRLTTDVFSPSPSSADGHHPGFELWAGTETGSVAVWTSVGMQYGVVEPDWQWSAHEATLPVNTAALHPSGSVVATCAGAWELPPDDDLGSRAVNPTTTRIVDGLSAVKIWSVSTGQAAAVDHDQQ